MEESWHVIEAVEDSMDSYYVPMNYLHNGPGFISRDALTRTQVKKLIMRLRRQRKEESAN